MISCGVILIFLSEPKRLVVCWNEAICPNSRSGCPGRAPARKAFPRFPHMAPDERDHGALP
jgi:hypothetical protein